MSARKADEPVSEPCPVMPTFVDALSGIAPAGAVTHLIFTSRTLGVPDGRMERVVQARLIVPTDQVQAIAKLMLGGRLDLSAPVDENGEAVGLH